MNTSEVLEDGHLWAFLVHFATNFATILCLVWAAYRPNRYNKEAVFTFFTFNLLIFCLCSLLLNCQIRLEFAFGLFAVFSMLRYRSVNLSMRDMTYLFAVVVIGLINAIEIGSQTLVLLADAILFMAVFSLERVFLQCEIGSLMVVIDKIELVKGEKSEELRQALCLKTGFQVTDYNITNINYLEQYAKIQVYFLKSRGMPSLPV
jgi:hypothetical protein